MPTLFERCHIACHQNTIAVLNHSIYKYSYYSHVAFVLIPPIAAGAA